MINLANLANLAHTRIFSWRLFTRVLLSAFIFLCSAQVISGTRDPNTPDSAHLEFGKKFGSVTRIRAKQARKALSVDIPPEPKYQYGSAVIIKPHWVLTAAHVVKDTIEPEIIRDSQHYPLAQLIIHADFNEDNIGYHDLALGYSPTDFQLEFYTPLYKQTDEIGKAVTISGYGVAGTFLSGGALSDGKRRAGHNKIDSTERAVLVCTPSLTNKFPLEFIITPGDSGGGLFIGNELAGINSFLMALDKIPDGTYTDEACFTRVSLYADWVESQIAKYELAQQGRATTSAAPTEISIRPLPK